VCKSWYGFGYSRLEKEKCVLITIAANIGDTAILDYHACFPDSLVSIKPKDKRTTVEFIHYILKFFKQNLLDLAPQVAQKNITIPDLENLQIPLPPLETQQKLVEMMDEAYSLKKEKEQKAKELLDSIDNFVMGELGIKFSSLRSTHEVGEVDNHSLEKSTPSGFQPATPQKGNIFGIKLSTLCRFDVEYNLPFYTKLENELKTHTGVQLKTILAKPIFSGKRPSGGVGNIKKGIPSLGGEHVNADGSIKSDKLKFVSEEFAQKHKNIFVKKNSLLLVKDGATTGKIGKIPGDYPFDAVGINEHVFCLEPDLKKVNLDYLFCVVRTDFIQQMLQREITGGTVTGLTADVVENLILPLPPLPIQQKIADEVEKRRSEAFELQAEARQVLETSKRKFESEVLE